MKSILAIAGLFSLSALAAPTNPYSVGSFRNSNLFEPILRRFDIQPGDHEKAIMFQGRRLLENGSTEKCSVTVVFRGADQTNLGLFRIQHSTKLLLDVRSESAPFPQTFNLAGDTNHSLTDYYNDGHNFELSTSEQNLGHALLSVLPPFVFFGGVRDRSDLRIENVATKTALISVGTVRDCLIKLDRRSSEPAGTYFERVRAENLAREEGRGEASDAEGLGETAAH